MPVGVDDDDDGDGDESTGWSSRGEGTEISSCRSATCCLKEACVNSCVDIKGKKEHTWYEHVVRTRGMSTWHNKETSKKNKTEIRRR